MVTATVHADITAVVDALAARHHTLTHQHGRAHHTSLAICKQVIHASHCSTDILIVMITDLAALRANHVVSLT